MFSVCDVEKWIVELFVLIVGKGVGGFDVEFFIFVYLLWLLEYLVDVVWKLFFGKIWKWFLIWDELKKVCDSLVSLCCYMIVVFMCFEFDFELKCRVFM